MCKVNTYIYVYVPTAGKIDIYVNAINIFVYVPINAMHMSAVIYRSPETENMHGI